MTFLETRGILARLLATENLVVNHETTATTARFNTETRTLTLPVLETDNENVYNLFIGHEVGHALETPTDWREQVIDGTPFDFVNVIEDVRIEKHVQNKFPGLRRDFAAGYAELNDKDFFGIKGKDLNKFSLIDRLNLHFKLGSLAMVPFTEEEQMWVQAIDECDTYQKVCLTSKMLSDWLNDKQEDKQEDNSTDNTDGEGDEAGEDTAGEEEQKKETEDETNEESQDEGESEPEEQGGGVKGEEEEIEQPENNGGTEGAGVDENVSQTQSQFDKSMEDLAESHGRTITYVTTPTDERALQHIITAKELRQDFVVRTEAIRENCEAYLEGALQQQRETFSQFLSSIKKDVSFMAQQFEMKKSAAAYARQSINKTGVLNTARLHEYKLTDDIFLRQSVTPDGKSHGLIMFVDWSGSMHDVLRSTVKQLIVLVQYCRKVQIPFEVYTFTTSGQTAIRCDEACEKDAPGSVFTGSANIVQVMTSSAKNRDIDTDMFNLWCQVKALESWSSYVPSSKYLEMGGTPLDSALFAVPALVRKFRSQNKAEKVSFVCLTDGESSPVAFTRKTDSGKIRMGTAYHDRIVVRDGSTAFPLFDNGFAYRDSGFIATWLEKKIEGLTCTNIFLGKVAAGKNYLFSNGFGNQSQHRANYPAKFRKDGSFTTREGTWPMMSIVDPKVFGDAIEEIQVDDGASKVAIRNALKKYLKSKTSSKVLLTNLIEQFS